MNKKISLAAVLVMLLLCILVTFNITYLTVNNKYSHKLKELEASYSEYDKLGNLKTVVKNHYIGSYSEDLLPDGMARGLVEGIGDRYARYFSEEEYQTFLAGQNSTAVGIGVIVKWQTKEEAAMIVYVTPGSPAEEAGLKATDMIVGIGDETSYELGYDGLTERIKGEAGTELTLTVIRDGTQEITVTLRRASVVTRSVLFHSVRVGGETTDIGYILLTEFNGGTPGQLQEALSVLRAQGAQKLIFDLRDNPGGELNSITQVLDLILPEGPIVRMEDREGNITTENSDAAFLDLPFCVLVNGSTASAAELFTSAVKDYAAKGLLDACVIGTKTYGKGTMQSVFRLADGSAVSLSTKMFSPPFSENFEGKGVLPDLTLELNEEAAKISIYLRTDEQDNQIMQAVSRLNGSDETDINSNENDSND